MKGLKRRFIGAACRSDFLRIFTRGVLGAGAGPSRFSPDRYAAGMVDAESIRRDDDGSALVLDNVEGLSFGADHGGRQTLVLVCDDNFASTQTTQLTAPTVDGSCAVPVPEPGRWALLPAWLAAMGAFVGSAVRRNQADVRDGRPSPSDHTSRVSNISSSTPAWAKLPRSAAVA